VPRTDRIDEISSEYDVFAEEDYEDPFQPFVVTGGAELFIQWTIGSLRELLSGC
jgi:hypothetical protein